MSSDIGFFICAVIIGALSGIRATPCQIGGEDDYDYDTDSEPPMHLCLSQSSQRTARLPTSFFCRNNTPVTPLVYTESICRICDLSVGMNNTSMSANHSTQKLCWLPVSLHLLLVSWVFTVIVNKPSMNVPKRS